MRDGCPGSKTSISSGLEREITRLLMLRKVHPSFSVSCLLFSNTSMLLWLTLAITEQLNKTKVTGIKQVDQIQDDVNNLVGNQVGTNGLLAPVGNMISKEGVNRAERGGKDDKGTYGGPVAGYSDPVLEKGQAAGKSVAGGAQKVGSGVMDGAKGAGGYLGGLVSGGKK
jgi:hypothetical protein